MQVKPYVVEGCGVSSLTAVSTCLLGGWPSCCGFHRLTALASHLPANRCPINSHAFVVFFPSEGGGFHWLAALDQLPTHLCCPSTSFAISPLFLRLAGGWLPLAVREPAGRGGPAAALHQSFFTAAFLSLQVGGFHWLSENQPTVADQPPPSQAGTSAEGSIACAVAYRLLPGGGLHMEWEVDASNALPAPLPPGLSRCACCFGWSFVGIVGWSECASAGVRFRCYRWQRVFHAHAHARVHTHTRRLPDRPPTPSHPCQVPAPGGPALWGSPRIFPSGVVWQGPARVLPGPQGGRCVAAAQRAQRGGAARAVRLPE